MCRIFMVLLMMAQPLWAAKIEFWHSMSGPHGQVLKEVVSDFNELPENKGKWFVQEQFVGTYEEGLNKLRTSLLAKRGPHVAQVTDIGTQVMIDSATIVPLQIHIDKDPGFPAKELLLPIRRYYEIKGTLYSLPFATSNPIIYYNADWFKKAGIQSPPKTFAEFADVCRKLTNKEQKLTGVTWPLHSWFFEQFIARQGGVFANNDNGRKGRATELNFLGPEATEFVNLWVTLVKAGSFANVGRGWDPAEANFMSGRSAMLITSTSDVFILAKKATFKIATAPLPTKDPKVAGGTIVGGNSLWLLKNKPAEEEAASYRFLKYMASKPAQRKWHTNTGYFPIRGDLIADLEREGFYQKNPSAKTAIDQMRASADIPATWGALLGVFPETREAFENAMEQILAGRADAPTALKKAKLQAEQALIRYNKGRS